MLYSSQRRFGNLPVAEKKRWSQHASAATLPNKRRYEDGHGPYPDVSKNVDFKHSLNLVVLSREQISSCNHTSVIHQDGDVPDFLFHLGDRKNPERCVSFTIRTIQGCGRRVTMNFILSVVSFSQRRTVLRFQMKQELCSRTTEFGLDLTLLPLSLPVFIALHTLPMDTVRSV